MNRFALSAAALYVPLLHALGAIFPNYAFGFRLKPVVVPLVFVPLTLAQQYGQT